MTNLPRALCVVLFLPIVGCAHAPNQGAQPDPGNGVANRDGATIISGVALTDGRGSVLGAMQGKVPSMRIRNSGVCPEISFRSHASFDAPVNPHVYVDGTRISDTCVLESLRAHDVEAVEIYPNGVTKRPGYGFHAHGLILVFMRTGVE